MYAVILFILFPFFYNTSRTWYFIYALLFFLVGRFVAFKLGLSYAILIHNVFFIGTLLPFLTDKSYRAYIKPVILWALVYIGYLYFLHVIHGNDFASDLKANFRVLFVFIFAVQAFENIKQQKINLAYFVKIFKLILLSEILLCWLQYFFHDIGDFFRIASIYRNGMEVSMSGESADLLESNICLGTLMKASACANYLTSSIVVLFLAKRKAGFSRDDYVFLVFCVLTLLITGIRAPFLVLILMLYFILMKGRSTWKKIAYIAVGTLSVIILLPILSNIGSQGGVESLDNLVMRNLNVFTQLETGSFVEESTFTWPLSMMPYIADHPFLGNGLHHGVGYFMALNFHVLEDLSISDAGFFFHWAEYGLVGVIVFFFFYYYVIKISPRYGFDKTDLRFLVIMLFLQSIVDCSVIDNYCTTVFALAPIVMRKYQLNN